MTTTETLKNLQVQVQEQLKTASAAVQASFQSAQAATSRHLESARSAVDSMPPNQKKAAAGVGAVVGVYGVYRLGRGAVRAISHHRRESMLKQLEQDGQIHLVMFPRSPWAPSLSPPCSKVETFLRLANIPYQVTELADTDGSPTGCVPFICYNGQRIAESSRIIDFLSAEFRVGMDASLSRQDRATGNALRSLVEYSLVPAYSRIAFVQNPEIATVLLSKAIHLPQWVARIAVKGMGASMEKNLQATSFGTQTAEQYEREFLRGILAIEQQIGTKSFLFGDAPTTYDCVAYALLVPFANMKQYAEMNDTYLAVAQSRVLMDYVARMNDLAFPDLGELIAATEATRSEMGDADPDDSVLLDADQETAVPDAADEEEAAQFARDVRAAVESDPFAQTDHASLEVNAGDVTYPTEEGMATPVVVAA